MIMTRRQAIKTAAFAAAALAAMPKAFAQFFDSRSLELLGAGEIPFKLPRLPYPFNALEPFIDAPTMEAHHAKHHASYVKSLNLSLAHEGFDFYKRWVIANRSNETGITEEMWLDDTLLRDMNSVPEKIRAAVRLNGGGHYNHSLFWQMMKKDGGGEPKGELAEAIKKQFKSFDGFKDKFTKVALNQPGNGWAWLTLDGKELKIETTANEDTPISSGHAVLLGIDVWEHAYKLQYKNDRAGYVNAWFKVVNWDFVAERYTKLIK